MPQWQKPENALRRANELLEVGKKQDALDTLHDVIKARKHRTWTKVHELIMAKHLELCVELRKPHLAKDGLFQYRNMCQQVNVKSLEDVVTQFLEQAEKKAEQARQASQGLVEDVAEDLDQAETPERLLLSAVSGEGAQDRADRAVLSPWLRFLWESYRQCLELLRNNVQVEQLYHKVAKQAFHFCLKYQRRAEFRKLCDNLRTHVNQLQKAHQHYAVKLSNPESLALHQETRLCQLDVAIQMELWQEAYKSAEDVHQLMQSAKRSAKPQMMASYYERLALIFWKAGNTLYHTAALFKLFQLHKDMKKSFTSEEATHLATRLLLATLSIRWSDQVHDFARHLEMEEAHVEHQRRLASLLTWPTPPTRQILLKEVQRLNVIGLALPPAQQLYQWLENEFSPLKLAPEIQRQLDAVKALDKAEYSQYVDTLQQVAALKILKQISQVYRSISLQHFLSIVPFFDIFRLERLIVAAGKKAQLQVRIDHRSGSVEFGVGEAMTFGSDDAETAVGGVGAVQLDVPIIQTMPSEHIRQYLQQMYVVLQDAVDSVNKDSVQGFMDKMKSNAKIYEYNRIDHHKQNLERKKRIEQYKEMLERIKTEQEELAKQQERKALEKRQIEDKARLDQENKERSEAQRVREREDLQRKVMQDRMDKMNPNMRKMMKDMPEEEMQSMDAETLLQKQIVHMEQEKRELNTKLRQQEKKWDYYVRAIHQVEIPMREAEYEQQSVLDRENWEKHEKERVEREEEEHHTRLHNHERLTRVESEAHEYLVKVRESRATEMLRQMEVWKQLLKDTRERRLKERKEERKEKRRQEWVQAKEEAERMKKEEEERKKREAEDQLRRPLDGKRGGFEDRRRPRDQDDGEPRGADADKWERSGPLDKERTVRFDDEAGRGRMGTAAGPGGPRRFGAGGRDEEGDGTDGADASEWRRTGPLLSDDARRAALPAEDERDRRQVRRGGDEETEAGPWRRGQNLEPAAPPPQQPQQAQGPPRQPFDDRRPADGSDGGPPGPWRRPQQPPPPVERAPEQDWRAGGGPPQPQPSGAGQYDEDRRQGYDQGPPQRYDEERRTGGPWRGAGGEPRGPPPPAQEERPWRGAGGGGAPTADRGGSYRPPMEQDGGRGSWRERDARGGAGGGGPEGGSWRNGPPGGQPPPSSEPSDRWDRGQDQRGGGQWRQGPPGGGGGAGGYREEGQDRSAGGPPPEGGRRPMGGAGGPGPGGAWRRNEQTTGAAETGSWRKN